MRYLEIFTTAIISYPMRVLSLFDKITVIQCYF